MAALACFGARGQLITNLTAIPKTGKLPVVFLNGYQSNCGGSSFSGTFARSAEILESDSRVSLFFENCTLPDHPPIEELGAEFGRFLARLRYTGDEPVTQVDVVAHSMGGLILRSYLSGKQTQAGIFTPPAETRIRKAVFLGTPHFGTPLASLLGPASDRQIVQLTPASTFLFDLATWNQGLDDLRGVDALAVLGNAGTFTGIRSFTDAVTSLTSGSLGFYGPGRTRIIPACHTDGIALLACSSTTTIAQINSPEHPTARILLSFLNDTSDWRGIGEAADQNAFLSTQGALLLQYRDANDRPQSISRAAAGATDFAVAGQLAYNQLLPSQQPVPLTLTLSNNTTVNLSVPLSTGATLAYVAKPGPVIRGVGPSNAGVFPRTVAADSLISLYGEGFPTAGAPEVYVAGQSVLVTYSDANQINSVVPAGLLGLTKIQVKTQSGEHTVNLFVESVVPALFAPAAHSLTGVRVTPDTPLRHGDYVTLYATGLGPTTTRADGLRWLNVQPEVTLGGQPCAVTFAGRAPAWVALDQINCQVSTAAQTGNEVDVTLRSGSRVSNTTKLPVR